jgi:hypothetical protein
VRGLIEDFTLGQSPGGGGMAIQIPTLSLVGPDNIDRCIKVWRWQREVDFGKTRKENILRRLMSFALFCHALFSLDENEPHVTFDL